MKQILLIFTYLIISLIIWGCKNDGNRNANENPVTQLESKQNIFEFGTIDQTDSIQHIFKIKNTGNIPLIIKSAAASCGCTTSEIPKKPILPGQSGEFKVKFMPGTGINGVVNKSIVLQANTQETFHVFYLKGDVISKS